MPAKLKASNLEVQCQHFSIIFFHISCKIASSSRHITNHPKARKGSPCFLCFFFLSAPDKDGQKSAIIKYGNAMLKILGEIVGVPVDSFVGSIEVNLIALIESSAHHCVAR
jgi:hypothetical protein